MQRVLWCNTRKITQRFRDPGKISIANIIRGLGFKTPQTTRIRPHQQKNCKKNTFKIYPAQTVVIFYLFSIHISNFELMKSYKHDLI